ETGFSDARNPLEQDVASGQQTRDRAIDDVLVTDDATADFAGDAKEALAKLVDGVCDGGARFFRSPWSDRHCVVRPFGAGRPYSLFADEIRRHAGAPSLGHGRRRRRAAAIEGPRRAPSKLHLRRIVFGLAASIGEHVLAWAVAAGFDRLLPQRLFEGGHGRGR